MQSHQFCQKLDAMNLIRSIDLIVQFDDDTMQTVQGLSSINEDQLQSLSEEHLYELHKLGYLIPIHSMLISIYQLNEVIRRNNTREGMENIKNIKIEVARDRSGA